jgi:hypothetical protein
MPDQQPTPVDPNAILKPGLKSSELYVTLATVILGFVLSKLGFSDEQKKQLVPQLVPIIITALAGAGYLVSRTFLKWKAMHSVVPAIANVATPPAAKPASAPAEGAPTKTIPAEPTGSVAVTDLTAQGDT